jgi:hypothetical protein
MEISTVRAVDATRLLAPSPVSISRCALDSLVWSPSVRSEIYVVRELLPVIPFISQWSMLYHV